MKLVDGDSLLLRTYQRAARVSRGDEILTVTNRDYYFMSKDEYGSANLGDRIKGAYLLEPFGRNTAPAVAIAAHHVADRYGRDAIMLIMAADHLIEKEEAFMAAVQDAVSLASAERLVTFGIIPTGPETGFGYIEVGDALDKGNSVASFKEKPSISTAEEYIASGRYLWNSGIFCFKAGVILDELEAHAPEVADTARRCWASLDGSNPFMQEIPEGSFADIPALPIDIAVMERSSRVAVVPADFGWSDIGSWNAVGGLVQPDGNGNRAMGDVVFVDTHDTFAKSEDRLVATIGIDNLLIIDTQDALLIAHSNRGQDVKEVVNQLKHRNHQTYRMHRCVARPWGTYTILEEGPRFKIKRIEVRPGRSLSLQLHHHRSEHWVVVSGMARVTIGEKEIFLRPNESTFIPAGQKHRLDNPGLLDLVMIEVQSGEYLGEDDIVRYEDIYGRLVSHEAGTADGV